MSFPIFYLKVLTISPSLVKTRIVVRFHIVAQ